MPSTLSASSAEPYVWRPRPVSASICCTAFVGAPAPPPAPARAGPAAAAAATPTKTHSPPAGPPSAPSPSAPVRAASSAPSSARAAPAVSSALSGSAGGAAAPLAPSLAVARRRRPPLARAADVGGARFVRLRRSGGRGRRAAQRPPRFALARVLRVAVPPVLPPLLAAPVPDLRGRLRGAAAPARRARAACARRRATPRRMRAPRRRTPRGRRTWSSASRPGHRQRGRPGRGPPETPAGTCRGSRLSRPSQTWSRRRGVTRVTSDPVKLKSRTMATLETAEPILRKMEAVGDAKKRTRRSGAPARTDTARRGGGEGRGE